MGIAQSGSAFVGLKREPHISQMKRCCRIRRGLPDLQQSPDIPAGTDQHHHDVVDLQSTVVAGAAATAPPTFYGAVGQTSLQQRIEVAVDSLDCEQARNIDPLSTGTGVQH